MKKSILVLLPLLIWSLPVQAQWVMRSATTSETQVSVCRVAIDFDNMRRHYLRIGMGSFKFIHIFAENYGGEVRVGIVPDPPPDETDIYIQIDDDPVTILGPDYAPDAQTEPEVFLGTAPEWNPPLRMVQGDDAIDLIDRFLRADSIQLTVGSQSGGGRTYVYEGVGDLAQVLGECGIRISRSRWGRRTPRRTAMPDDEVDYDPFD